MGNLRFWLILKNGKQSNSTVQIAGIMKLEKFYNLMRQEIGKIKETAPQKFAY